MQYCINNISRESDRNNVKFFPLSNMLLFYYMKRQWPTTITKRIETFNTISLWKIFLLSPLLPHPSSCNEITVSIFNRFLFIIHFDRETLSRDPLFTMTLPNAERKRCNEQTCIYTMYTRATIHSVETDDSIRK